MKQNERNVFLDKQVKFVIV